MSNQVYRDTQNSKSYNGEVYATAYPLVSNILATPSGTLGVEWSRADDRHAMLAVTGTAVGTAWDATTTLLELAPGTIPVDLRPRIAQVVSCWIFRPGGALFLPGKAVLFVSGAVQFSYPTNAGLLQAFVANDEISPFTVVYPIA